MHVCRAPVSTLKAAFMFPPQALGAIPSVRACISPPLCVFSSSSLSCTTCSNSPSSSKHWLRLRVIGRRTFSSDSLCSLSWSTCRGRCRGQMWRECKTRGEERLERDERRDERGQMGGKEFGHPGVAWKELREVQAAAAMSPLHRRSFLTPLAAHGPAAPTHGCEAAKKRRRQMITVYELRSFIVCDAFDSSPLSRVVWLRDESLGSFGSSTGLPAGAPLPCGAGGNVIIQI